jgi:hypothetical protein
MAPDRLTAARVGALFASDLSAQCRPGRAAVTDAISRAMARYGSIDGCADEVAAAYGDYPETAPSRMRWARQVIETLYPSAAAANSPGASPPFPHAR